LSLAGFPIPSCRNIYDFTERMIILDLSSFISPSISFIGSGIIAFLMTKWTIRRERVKIFRGIIALYQSILKTDKQALELLLQTCPPSGNVSFPVIPMSLTSSISDYIDVFSVNKDIAEQVMVRLYKREYLVRKYSNGITREEILEFINWITESQNVIFRIE
jgi:hypothetical protein